MGGIMGVIIGILAGYDIRGILTLGIQMLPSSSSCRKS